MSLTAYLLHYANEYIFCIILILVKIEPNGYSLMTLHPNETEISGGDHTCDVIYVWSSLNIVTLCTIYCWWHGWAVPCSTCHWIMTFWIVQDFFSCSQIYSKGGWREKCSWKTIQSFIPCIERVPRLNKILLTGGKMGCFTNWSLENDKNELNAKKLHIINFFIYDIKLYDIVN